MTLERWSGAGVARSAAILVAGSWCGALVFFAAVAGLVLKVAPSRHVGGTVNAALLDVLDLWSYGAAALLLVLVLALDRLEPLPRVQKGLAVRLLVVAAAAAFASHEVITPEMMSLRDRMPTLIDLMPHADPLRRSWARLHAYSASVLLVRILVTAGLVVLLARRTRPERVPTLRVTPAPGPPAGEEAAAAPAVEAPPPAPGEAPGA